MAINIDTQDLIINNGKKKKNSDSDLCSLAWAPPMCHDIKNWYGERTLMTWTSFTNQTR